MRFYFINSGGGQELAGNRYRVNWPEKYLSSAPGFERAASRDDADIVIFGKHFKPARDWRILQELKRRGVKTVFDICDWHFDTPELAPHYKRMAEAADGIVVPTDYWLTVNLPKKPHIAGDAYEFPEKQPRCEAHAPLRIFWHGFTKNMYQLESLSLPKDSELRIVSNSRTPKLAQSPRHQNFKHYSLGAMLRGFEWCDLVIVPAILPYKSPNRMIEAIRQGRFVVASDVPQHRPAGTWLGDILQGIEWYRHNLADALERLKQAQKKVVELYSPVVVGEQWRAALESIYSGAAA